MLLTIQTGDVVDELGFEAGYKALREAGFEAIDWNIDHAWNQAKIRKGELNGCIFEKSPEEVLAHYAEELDIIRKNGFVISQAHAPFPAHMKGVPELETYAVEIYKGCIRLCDAVGCKNLIIHGISCSCYAEFIRTNYCSGWCIKSTDCIRRNVWFKTLQSFLVYYLDFFHSVFFASFIKHFNMLTVVFIKTDYE